MTHTMRFIDSLAKVQRAWKTMERQVANGAEIVDRKLGDRSGTYNIRLYIREDLEIWMGRQTRTQKYWWVPFGILPLAKA